MFKRFVAWRMWVWHRNWMEADDRHAHWSNLFWLAPTEEHKARAYRWKIASKYCWEKYLKWQWRYLKYPIECNDCPCDAKKYGSGCLGHNDDCTNC